MIDVVAEFPGWKTCDRARLARDRSYDGVFFSGVNSTGIYCRPVCPVCPAKSVNVSFYPSAAAAEQAGYRPCLRCRPEAAPGSPAWMGTATTVGRAMRLIHTGYLDSNNVQQLAETLGIGSRHLARLFSQYLEATPSQVAATVRLQRAKRLIDTTDLTLAEIAFASGFGSIRRFNAVFQNLYGRPPSSLRRL
ncbi:Ada metal-binding domain-containing protein [Pseudovibrio sp. POLY-S9]|uniref:bifunctional transcriptional activator/DNA repair enzyme AdaA n=1 Tax=Pseudovibrio sp. POLY-S9 TaxID=1576596 RepID=UPI000710BB22|nr:Ada metal-binding domain-containing protein [Pseudovibrio sp. POLY-S9]